MKIKSLIISLLTIILFPVWLWAATPGTITGTLERMAVRQGSAPIIEIVLTCTAGDAAAYPVTVVNTLSGVSDYILKGLKLYSIKSIPSAVTAPTAGTSVTITDSRGVDLLGDKGSGLISNTAKTWAAFGPNNYAFPALIMGNFSVTITGNVVNGAIITLILEITGD
jgi:hypothetical protein